MSGVGKGSANLKQANWKVFSGNIGRPHGVGTGIHRGADLPGVVPCFVSFAAVSQATSQELPAKGAFQLQNMQLPV